MNFDYNNKKPDYIKEEWEGKWEVFSWLEFVCAIPHVLFVVTTVKENEFPNAAFQSWASFTGEGNDYYIIMSAVMKNTHTYENIKRNKEFCINFISPEYLEECLETTRDHNMDIDEISSAGFTLEDSKTIETQGISESFLKLECEYEWEKELSENSFNITVCGKVKHVSIDKQFGEADIKKRYGKDSFMFNLHNPMNPFNGESFGNGIGVIEYLKDMF